MSPKFELPDDPLVRFFQIAEAVADKKRWFQGWTMLRFAAMNLQTVPGDPRELVERLYSTAEELSEEMRWFSSLRGDVRYCIAATAIKAGFNGHELVQILEQTRQLYRDAKLKRGELHEALATLVLAQASASGRPTKEQVDRMVTIWSGMRENHRFLTNSDDYPASALLSQRDEALEPMLQRLTNLYQNLRELKFSRGNQLQLATHLLYFAEGDDMELAKRFRALYKAFADEGLFMGAGDYDEIAILSILDHDPAVVVKQVLQDRETMRERLSPRPSKQEGFTFASSTAFLTLAVRNRELSLLTDAIHLNQVVSLIQTQQAAAIAAASAASAAAAAG